MVLRRVGAEQLAGSWRDRVRLSEPIAKDREKVDEVLLLLSSELEIADLAVRLGRLGRFGGWDSRDVLHIVEDLGRREQRSIAGWRAFTEVEGYLLTTGVHGNVPLVIKMDDLLETFEYAVMHVCLYKSWVGALVHVAHAWCLKEPTELGNITRNLIVESGSIRRWIGIRAQTVIDGLFGGGSGPAIAFVVIELAT